MRERQPSRLVTLCALGAALAAGSLGLHLALLTRLQQTGVLNEENVLFDADPSIFTMSYATGRNPYQQWGGRNFAHPNLSNAVYPMVAGIAAALSPAGPASATSVRVGPSGWIEVPHTPQMAARRQVALLIAPLAAGAETAVVFATFLTLGFGLWTAAALTTIETACFSGLLFGTIPESYGLTGLALAVTFLVAARATRSDRLPPWGVWIGLGVIVGGITITNVATVGLVAFVVMMAVLPTGRDRSQRWWRAIRGATSAVTVALALTAGLYRIGGSVFGDAPPFDPAGAQQTNEAGWYGVTRIDRDVPLGIANTFAPPTPAILPVPGPIQPHQYTLTFRDGAGPYPGEVVRVVAVYVALALALVALPRVRRPARPVVIAAAAVLAYNWVVHAIYGKEMFLYSQHWALAALILLSALLLVPRHQTWTGRIAIGAVGVATLWYTVAAWIATLAILDQHVR